LCILAMVLTSCGVASAQAPRTPITTAPVAKPPTTAALVRLAPAISTQTPARPAPEPTTTASFGCDARAPNVCHFRIFYQRGDRVVILAAGMKTKVPGVTVGRDYCMTLGKTPAYKCARKVINGTYNS
jgi:hypothetical protein